MDLTGCADIVLKQSNREMIARVSAMSATIVSQESCDLSVLNSLRDLSTLHCSLRSPMCEVIVEGGGQCWWLAQPTLDRSEGCEGFCMPSMVHMVSRQARKRCLLLVVSSRVLCNTKWKEGCA